MKITKEVGEKMGMVPHPKTTSDLLKNLRLAMVYQIHQSEIDNCLSLQEVEKLGILPYHKSSIFSHK